MIPSFLLSWLLPGDNGITQTVNAIRSAVFRAIRDARIRTLAERIIATCPERDEGCEVSRIFAWVKDHFRYVRDPRGLELVKEHGLMLQEIAAQGFFQGDCDDVSFLIAALLTSIGYPVQLVTISVKGHGPEFRHIYPRVFLRKANRWLSLEATARNKPIGWNAEADRVREHDL